MANTRFSVTNHCVGATISSTATVIDANFPVTNLSDADRYSRIQTTATASGTVYIDVDLGANFAAKPVQAFAILNHAILAGNGIQTWNVFYGGSPSPRVNSLLAPPVVLGRKNVGSTLLNPFTTNRYYSFALGGPTLAAGPDRFALGSVWLGTLADLGIVYSSGSAVQARRLRSVTSTISGLPVINDYGNPYKTFSLSFANIVEPARAQIETLATARGSLLYFDQNDNVYECRLEEHLVGWQHVFSPPDLFNGTVNLIELP